MTCSHPSFSSSSCLHLASGLADKWAEHDSSVSREHAAAQDINTKTSEHQRVAQELERKKAELDRLQQRVRRFSFLKLLFTLSRSLPLS